MSAKKAGKTRTASPPGKATRFPRTETALRGAPRAAADDNERSPAEVTVPEAVPASAPTEPAAAAMAETAAVGVGADNAVAAADLAAASAGPAEAAAHDLAAEEVAEAAEVAPAIAIPAGLALDALTPEPPGLSSGRRGAAPLAPAGTGAARRSGQ
jgi:hypothetical protein